MPSIRDDCKVYVGELGNEANEDELERAFKRYGALKKVWVARKPPGFAFIEFEHSKDAEDAAKALDGRTICGRRVKVQLSHGRSRWPEGRAPSHLLRRSRFDREGSVQKPRRRSSDRGYREVAQRRGRSRSRSRDRTSTNRKKGMPRTRSRSPVLNNRNEREYSRRFDHARRSQAHNGNP